MSAAELLEKAKALPFAERVELFKQLRDSIAEDRHDPDLTPKELEELDRRAERALAHPEACRPLDDVTGDSEG